MDKRGPRLILTLAVVCLFCVPSAVESDSKASEGAAAARGEYRQTEPAELEFNNTTLSNSSFSFSLPSNSTIYSASVDLEGRPVVGPLQQNLLDFSGDTTSLMAVGGTYTKNTPGSAKPNVFAGTQLQAADIGRIASSDGTYAEQWAYSYGSTSEYGYHHFKFKVPLDIVTNITVTWQGYSGYYSYGYGGYGTSIAYIWNNVSLAWETVGQAAGGPKSVTKQFFGSNYTDGNNCVHVLALTYAGYLYYGYYMYNNMDTDYVKVEVQGNELTYPKDPSLDIGANGKMEWSLKEDKFNYQVNVGDVALTNELQTLVRNAPGRYAPIKFRFNSASIGKLNVTNFTVAFNSPPWCKAIPDTYRIDEDTPMQKLIDLNRYFEDDQDRTRYEIVYQEDSTRLAAAINSDGHSLDFKLPTKNWWGTLQFRLRATDPEDPPLFRESNTFKVTVRPVNDPPFINPVSKQVAVQDKPFKLTVSARDVDSELDPNETMTFSDNSSLFDINTQTGVIAFTPRQDQVGTYLIQITATDKAGAKDKKNFTLEIQDAEDTPVLDPIPELTATQDQPFVFKVGARDPDLPYGDALSFSDDSPLFQINADTGYFEFTPTIKDVGVHKVTITVADRAGLKDNRTFNLVILNPIGNLDRPPSIQPVTNQTAQEGVPFQLGAKGADPDMENGDVLKFSDDCPVFDIDAATGKVAFTPARSQAGTYKVTLTVKDNDGLSASTEFWLTVLKTNHPPEITSVVPEDGMGTETNNQVFLCATATDPDGDELNYTWKIGGEVIGYGASTSITFGERGTYIITVTVSDGQLQQVNETSVVVNVPSQTGGNGGRSKSPIPGFGAWLAAGAAAAALAFIAVRRKR